MVVGYEECLVEYNYSVLELSLILFFKIMRNIPQDIQKVSLRIKIFSTKYGNKTCTTIKERNKFDHDKMRQGRFVYRQ